MEEWKQTPHVAMHSPMFWYVPTNTHNHVAHGIVGKLRLAIYLWMSGATTIQVRGKHPS